MANEIQIIHDDGAETVYAIVRDMAGNWYYGTNPEAFDDANWGDYDIALAAVHACTSGSVAVQATFPAVAAGFYWIDVYVQAGANPAQTDYRVCSCLMYWDEAALVPAGGAADARQIAGSAPAAADVAKESSVGAIATILAGITSLANWLRGLYRKDTINSTALSEINSGGGAYSATTDSNEALADKTGGLTAQQTRDALKLAPSNGTPAAGSVDAELDAIGLKTATIGSGRITYASTVGEASLATLWAGDDYRAADGTQFSITVEDYAGPSLATATAKLRIMDSVQYLSAVDGVSVKADLQVAATIAIDGTTITLAADLTAAQTAAFETSPPQLAHNYVYEFVCTLANGHIGYRTHGRMTVKKAIAAGT